MSGGASIALSSTPGDGKLQADAVGNAKVALPQAATPANVGALRIFSENDNGSKTGTAQLRSPKTSLAGRLRVGIETLLFTDRFNGLTQNTNNWSYTFATMTAAQPGAGSVNFGVVQGTANSHGAMMRTFQYFPIFGTAPIRHTITVGMHTAPLVPNEVWASGFGLPVSAIAPPTDGFWFQLTSAGLIGRICYNGTFTDTGVLKSFGDFAAGVNDSYCITATDSLIEWRCNDELLLATPVSSGQGQPAMQISLPAFMMKYNTGSVSNTNTMRVFDVDVSMDDMNTQKPWSHQMAAAGAHSSVGQNGHTQGSTAGNLGNTSAIPNTAAGSNTVANFQGLGGVGVMTAEASNAAAGGNKIFSSFTNPAATINITGKNLHITGCKISAINTGAAVVTTPTTLLWTLAYGHTADSMATAESATFATATTHAARQIPLGFMSAAIAAAIGAPYDKELNYKFETPIVVRPGERIATTVRFIVGTATGSQSVTATVTFDGYFE